MQFGTFRVLILQRQGPCGVEGKTYLEYGSQVKSGDKNERER